MEISGIYVRHSSKETEVYYISASGETIEEKLFTTKEEAAQAWLASNGLKIALV